MEMLIPGLCGLVVIIGLVAIVMSRANWSIPQMILVSFVLLSSLVFFYFAARTFVQAKNWNDQIKDYTVAINEVEHGKTAGNQILEKGIEQLKQDRDTAKRDVEVALADRGRVWHEASIARVNSDTGEITATVEDPSPHGIDPNSTLFVFEQKDFTQSNSEAGGHYLGEFHVTYAKPGDKLIKMAPSLALLQGELSRISQSHGRIDLYEIMPADSHTLFTQLDNRDQMLKTAFSGEVLPEYSKDFGPAADTDPEASVYRWMKFKKEWTSDKVPGAAPPAGAAPAAGAPGAAANGAALQSFKPGDVALFDPKTAADLKAKDIADYDTDRPDKGKVYVRELHDYAQLFREVIRQRTALNADLTEVTAQSQRITAAKDGVLADVAAVQKDRDGLKKDLAKFQAEHEAVTAFLAALDRRNEELRADLSKTFRENIRMAAELDQLNRRLIDEINRRNPPVQAQASLAIPSR